MKLESGVIDTPPAGYVRFYPKADKILYYKDDTGAETQVAPITTEQIQDVIGALLVDSSTIDVTYNDAGNVLSLTVIQSALDHTQFQNIGTNTHAQIDTAISNSASHIANTSNPHNTTAAQVGADPTGTASGLLASHVAAADPHTQYLTAAEGTAAYDAIGAASAAQSFAIQRGNHTGTQLASTISNFASTVLSTVLSGFVAAAGTVAATDTVLQAFQKLQGTITAGIAGFANDVRNTVLTGLSIVNSAVTSADSILVAIGKLQGQINDLILTDNQWTEVVTTGNLTNNSAITGTNITELNFPVVAGRNYYVEYTIVYSTAATTTGIALTITSPDGASATGAVKIDAQVAADGTAAGYTGHVNTLGSYVTSTGVRTANATFIANIKGSFHCDVSGTFQPTFRSEVFFSNVTVYAGSVGLIREFV